MFWVNIGKITDLNNDRLELNPRYNKSYLIFIFIISGPILWFFVFVVFPIMYICEKFNDILKNTKWWNDFKYKK